jgi:arsenite methyltransferase
MSDKIIEAVQSKYAALAKSGLSTSHSGVRAVAEAFGYTPEQLASIPGEANMGVSCGNPTAFASLKPGEVVVDLGCGGGLDVFLAAKRVGPTGKAIGIDMTPEMLELARRNAAKADGGKPFGNIEFHQATIDTLPLPDASVDCVISNCVINLAPNKPAVFRETVRVLKPGGRLAVSDIALKKPLPPELGNDLMAYVGCIAGAIPIEQYHSELIEAGFAQVDIIDTGSDLNTYAKLENQSSCCSPSAASTLPLVSADSCCSSSSGGADFYQRLADLLRRYNVNDYAASVRVFAVKPTLASSQTRVQAAVSLFTSGLSCSQAILRVYGEGLGVDRDVANRIAAGFGGGMGQMAGMCGAVTGAFMVLGLKYGGEDRQARLTAYEHVRDFMGRFNARNSSVTCKDLLECDISTPQGHETAKQQKLFSTRCPKFVQDTAEILEEML